MSVLCVGREEGPSLLPVSFLNRSPPPPPPIRLRSASGLMDEGQQKFPLSPRPPPLFFNGVRLPFFWFPLLAYSARSIPTLKLRHQVFLPQSCLLFVFTVFTRRRPPTIILREEEGDLGRIFRRQMLQSRMWGWREASGWQPVGRHATIAAASDNR